MLAADGAKRGYIHVTRGFQSSTLMRTIARDEFDNSY